MTAACEQSSDAWSQGERLLESGELVSWCRYSLDDEETAVYLEILRDRSDIKLTRKLNSFLYFADPERPFRFFADPENFQVPTAQQSVTAIDAFMAYADQHWQLAVDHLYRGELIQWITISIAFGSFQFHDLETPTQFYDRVCAPFKASQHLEGLGLEALLEFLDRNITKPEIIVRFDETQIGQFSLSHWDAELSHQPIRVVITNTTRGYVAGYLELQTEKNVVSSKPWIAWSKAELQAATPPQDHIAFTLSGKDASVQHQLYLGNFTDQPKGTQLQQYLTVQRFLGTNYTEPYGTYPLKLKLMRYLQGFRWENWRWGLLGNLPGAVLDGCIGFTVGLLIFVLGVALAPQHYWGLISPQLDFTGNLNAWLILDSLLTIIFRAPYLAIMYLGFMLPLLMGICFAFSGFWIGIGKGHMQWSQQKDEKSHRIAGRWYAWLIIGYVGLQYARIAAPQIVFYLERNHQSSLVQDIQLPYFLMHQSNLPPYLAEWFPLAIFNVLVFLVPFISVLVGMNVVFRVRNRIRFIVSKQYGELINPPGKG